jgi:hypothetical protein
MMFLWDLLVQLFQADGGEGGDSDGRWQIDPDG